MTKTINVSMTDQIIAYENGELEGEEVVDLFQNLIDSGMVWHLQGHYGRTAMDLLAAGVCGRPSSDER